MYFTFALQEVAFVAEDLEQVKDISPGWLWHRVGKPYLRLKGLRLNRMG